MDYKKIYACINSFRQTGDTVYIDEIEKLLDEAIRAEGAKKNGKKNQLSALTKVLKRADMFYNKPVKVNDFQVFCDGYILAALKSNYDFEMLSDTTKQKTAENLVKSFGNIDKRDLLPISLPSVAELKAEKKILKSKYKSSTGFYTYDFGKDKPAVNIDYLIDVINISDCTEVYYSSPISALYFFLDDGGFCALMPVKKK